MWKEKSFLARCIISASVRNEKFWGKNERTEFADVQMEKLHERVFTARRRELAQEILFDFPFQWRVSSRWAKLRLEIENFPIFYWCSQPMRHFKHFATDT